MRVTGDTPAARHREHRVGGADANPYPAIAACLAGGTHGLERGLELADRPARPGDNTPPPRPLTATLAAAVDLLEASPVARDLPGGEFVDHLVAVKRHEAGSTARRSPTGSASK